jgi:hypothetical protein
MESFPIERGTVFCVQSSGIELGRRGQGEYRTANKNNEVRYPLPTLHQGHLFALRLTDAAEPASIRTPVAWEAIEYGRS